MLKRPIQCAGLLALLTALAAAPVPPPAAAPIPLFTGWSVLKEGSAEGAFEADAKNENNPDPHLLKIVVTNYVDAGKGRFGAKNSTPIAVTDDHWYDIAFNGTKEGRGETYGVGLVFSLETDDGKVLARTTLPEIGRGGRGGGGRGRGGAAATPAPAGPPATAAFRTYTLSLHARGTAANAHLTVTPIEPIPVWIQSLSIVERPAK